MCKLWDAGYTNDWNPAICQLWYLQLWYCWNILSPVPISLVQLFFRVYVSSLSHYISHEQQDCHSSSAPPLIGGELHVQQSLGRALVCSFSPLTHCCTLPFRKFVLNRRFQVVPWADIDKLCGSIHDILDFSRETKPEFLQVHEDSFLEFPSRS